MVTKIIKQTLKLESENLKANQISFLILVYVRSKQILFLILV